MKNILFISHDASRSGAPNVLLSVLKEVKRRNPLMNISLICLNGGVLLPEFKRYATVCLLEDNKKGINRLLPWSLRRKLTSKHLHQFIKSKNWDFIYANTIVSLDTAIKAKEISGANILLHVHEMEKSFRYYNITKEMFAKVDRFIAVSSTVVSSLINYDISKDIIKVVRPFSANLDNNTIINNINIPNVNNDDFVIGFAGIGSYRKGADFFPLLVHNFTTKHPNVKAKFIWVGQVDQLDITYDAEMLGIKDRIVLTGAVSNPMDYFNRFDVFALTSREDPFPIVCMETAYLAKPCVVFEGATGIVDLVKDNLTGLVVPYLDIDAMCDALYRLYSDIELRNRLGNNIRTELIKNCSKEQSLNSIIDILSI